MFNSLSRIDKKYILKTTKNDVVTRHFYKWLINIFNGTNEFRIEEVGPDRACAEWLLRNGAAIKWKGTNHYLRDYNLLPKEQEKHILQAVDATDSAIHHIGFNHFCGCNYIEEVKLVRCSYIENEALSLISILNNTLKKLEVIDCKNVDDAGLLKLKKLTNLKTLRLGCFPYVENKDKVMSELTAALPNCKIVYE